MLNKVNVSCLLLMGLSLFSSTVFAEQKIIFSVTEYSATSNVHVPDYVRVSCIPGCSKVDQKIKDYLNNGWRIVSVIPNQSIEVKSIDKTAAPYVKCICTGNEYVIEKGGEAKEQLEQAGHAEKAKHEGVEGHEWVEVYKDMRVSHSVDKASLSVQDGKAHISGKWAYTDGTTSLMLLVADCKSQPQKIAVEKGSKTDRGGRVVETWQWDAFEIANDPDYRAAYKYMCTPPQSEKKVDKKVAKTKGKKKTPEQLRAEAKKLLEQADKAEGAE